MEWFAYQSYLAIAVIIACVRLSGATRPRPALVVLWFVLSVALVAAYRSGNWDADMPGYVAAMAWTEVPDRYAFEPILWKALQVCYSVIGDETGTLLVLDTVGLFVMWIGLKSMRAPYFSYFGLVVFFPIVLGLQNGYRQFFGMMLSMYAFALMRRTVAGAVAILALATLTHTASIAVIPTVVARRNTRPASMTAVGGAILASLVMAPLAEMKGDKLVGFDFSALYLGVVLAIALAAWLPFGRISAVPASGLERLPSTVAAITMIGATISFSSAWIERLGMFFLVLAYPSVCATIASLPFVGRLARPLCILAGALPLVLVHTTRYFVMPPE